MSSGVVLSMMAQAVVPSSASAQTTCPLGQISAVVNGSADQVVGSFAVREPDNSLAVADGAVAELRSVGRLTLDLENTVPENGAIEIRLTRANDQGSVRVTSSVDGNNFSGAVTYGATGDIVAGPANTLETITYTVPAGGARYLQFQGLSFVGQVNIDAVSYGSACVDADYGDAPSAYGTLRANGGPAHGIVPGLLLGSVVDADSDGFGNGVDTNGNAADDSPGDDGVASFPRLYDDSFDDAYTYNLNVTVTNTTGQDANLVGWIDFDGNQQFDRDESVAVTVANGSNAANVTLAFAVPTDVQSGTTYARLRLSRDGLDGDMPLGVANDGEVEDYVVTISSALPLPTNLSCGSPISFPWEGDPGGFVWAVDDTFNRYSIPNLYDVDMTLTDPQDQNLDSGNPGTFSPPGYTRSAGVFGAGLLTWSMTAANANQLLTNTIEFSEASVLNDMTIADVDGNSLATSYNTQYDNYYVYGTSSTPPSITQAAYESFQDEISVTASFQGVNVPVSLSAGEPGLLTISGQSARGYYPTPLSVSDARGQVRLSTSGPIDTLVIEYSNGPEDAAAEQPYGGNGLSDDQSIAVQLWTFCEAFPEIGGTVWLDADADGVRDGGESAIANVGVELYEASDRNNPQAAPVAVTTSASDGRYLFSDQRPADYFVRFVSPADKALTSQDQGTDDTVDSDADASGNTADFALLSGGDLENIDAGLVPTVFVSAPEVLLAKRITAVNGDRTQNPLDSTVLNTVVDDGVADSADDHPNWPANYLLGALHGGSVRPVSSDPADRVEYSIYFLSAGGMAAENVLLCDRIPENTVFLPDAYDGVLSPDVSTTQTNMLGIALQLDGAEVALSGADDGDAGYYFPPLVEPSTQFPNIVCGGPNSHGAVVVDLGDLPASTGAGTPVSAYGAMRFYVQVD